MPPLPTSLGTQTIDQLRAQLEHEREVSRKNTEVYSTQITSLEHKIEELNSIIESTHQALANNDSLQSSLKEEITRLKGVIEPFRRFASLHGTIRLNGNNTAVITESDWAAAKAVC